MVKLTESRKNALLHVAGGKVRRVWPMTNAGAARFVVEGLGQSVRQDTYKWLVNEGLIRADAPSLRGTPYVLTAKGSEVLAEATA